MHIIVKGQRPVSLFLKNILTSNCFGIMVLYLIVLIVYRITDYGFDFLNLFYALVLLNMTHSLRKMYKNEVETYDLIRKQLHAHILKLGYSTKEDFAKIFPINRDYEDIPEERRVKIMESVRTRIHNMVSGGNDSFEAHVTLFATAIYDDYFKSSLNEFNKKHKWLYYGENSVYVCIIMVTIMMLALKIM